MTNKQKAAHTCELESERIHGFQILYFVKVPFVLVTAAGHLAFVFITVLHLETHSSLQKS